MSRMLNLAEGLLGLGRTHQQMGQDRNAFSILSRLAAFRSLPGNVAEETQARLGELQLKRRKFNRAARHLTAAVQHDPTNARYHHLLGCSVRDQGKEHWERAAEHFRRALELEADRVETLTDLGILYVRLGRADDGIALLRRASELKPNDPDVLSRLVRGLRLAGRNDDARSEARCAQFRNPHDRRFQQVWNVLQFKQVRREQQKTLRSDSAEKQDGPVLLRFPSVTGISA